MDGRRAMLAVALTTIFSAITWTTVDSLDNGLALTPPMGFLSWQRYRCQTNCQKYPDSCINEKLYMDMADKMVQGGYKDAGYSYVIIDDCWLAHNRDANGRLQPDPDRFPSGIRNLSDYIHNLGLKFGIYEDFGNLTCAGYPGVVGHLETDAETFASWGVDYLKLDGCNSKLEDMNTGYPEMGRYLNKTGRPIVYSCSWPAYWVFEKREPDYTAIATTCNLWRNFDDIEDDWNSVNNIIDYYANVSDIIVPHAGPGNWNDPDMLLIGNYGLSLDQSKVQMAMWAIMASPLLISTDLRDISDEHKAIILNKELIAVNQDPAGIQGRRLLQRDRYEVWSRPILPIAANRQFSYALAILNRNNGGSPSIVQYMLSNLGLQNELGYLVTDLYDDTIYGILNPSDNLTVTVNPVGVVAVRAQVISSSLFDEIGAYAGTKTNEII